MVEREADLIVRSPEQHRSAGIDVRMCTEVTGIDLDRRVVIWRDLEEGSSGTEPFDDLVYATGSVPMRPPVPGIDAPGVYGVQVLDDGVALTSAFAYPDTRVKRESCRNVTRGARTS